MRTHDEYVNALARENGTVLGTGVGCSKRLSLSLKNLNPKHYITPTLALQVLPSGCLGALVALAVGFPVCVRMWGKGRPGVQQ